MSSVVERPAKPAVEYPDSDGQPMSDNTLQFEWIITIKGGLDAVFRDDPNVLVAGDLLWYAVEGDPTVRTAPDAMVVFGRPKGYRGSYMQWVEENIPPQVVFEVLSPGNRPADLIRKHRFYEKYGVEEYYIYDPDRKIVEGWQRQGETLQEIPEMAGWVSLRLKVRFEIGDDRELRLYGPDNRTFATYAELVEQRDRAEREKTEAEQQRQQAEQQRQQAEQQRQQAEQQRQQAEQQRQQAERELEQARLRAERLAAQLRALGIKPENGVEGKG
jgi:Uma2 family endonuclease